jgi:L-histidine Nalpha-methyltransferase
MSTANVTIHASQFPENVRRDLLTSLRTRRVNHKFHYDSHKQTQKWLALHEAHSPARTDKDCLDTYDLAFIEATKKIAAKKIHVIGLGCGGGQKDSRLLELLKKSGNEIFYTPSDVSVAMTLVAREAALKILPAKNCFPFVCDLATSDLREGRRVGDLDIFGTATRRPSQNAARLITFFGMIPNFEPDEILPKLAALVRKNDFLLFSANLAPGKDYVSGVKKILPQYDNELTHDWLLTFLLDLGIERDDGNLRFSIEEGALKLKRVIAIFHFSRAREISVHGEKFKFHRSDSIQVFFSYRYTPERVEENLFCHGLKVQTQWLAASGEEGVFLCRRIA